MNPRGEELVLLDVASVETLAEKIDACSAEAVAICLLHRYVNPAHEQALADLLATHRSGLVISISSEVNPEAREFERQRTTVDNAYIQPLMSRYLDDFAVQFAAQGLPARS